MVTRDGAPEVQLHPTKRLFIETVTKDASIQACAFDLFDNAVDSYLTHRLTERRLIKADFDKHEFTIYDSCGGISRHQLINEVFRFGLVSRAPSVPTIGIYGIGLKRAIFKMGRRIRFESDDGKDYSCLNLNVDEWVKKGEKTLSDWSIPLTEYGKSRLRRNDNPYTRIEITHLSDETKETFTAAFAERFKQKVREYYTLFIRDRIDVIINGEKQPSIPIEIKVRPGYTPGASEASFDGVTSKVICWVAYKEEARRMVKERGRQGWNVFMNQRLILHDNVGPETGWSGEAAELPKYHSLFNEFRGLVFLSSKDPSRLPVNTTKDAFDHGHGVYWQVLRQMMEVAKPVVKFLSRKYPKQKEAIDEIEEETEDLIKRDQRATEPPQTITVAQVPAESHFKVPLKMVHTTPKTVRIQYDKPRDRVTKLKKVLSAKSASETGSESFDYCYNALVGGAGDE
jgi:hypothetical protein